MTGKMHSRGHLGRRALAAVAALAILLTLTGSPARSAPAPAKPAPAPAAPAKPEASPKGQPQSPPPAQGSPSSAAGQGTAPTGPNTGDIDEILQGEEDVLSGNGFSYDPGNRRDPFKSLLAGPERTEIRGPRPEGIPGLLIDEIDLKGIWKTGKGYVAQVVATNQKKTYLLKEGDQLYDGDVVSISHAEVVFKQIVQDPTALKPFREVVKSLNPSS
jgi:Tfp pilus assembly protein PilP